MTREIDNTETDEVNNENEPSTSDTQEYIDTVLNVEVPESMVGTNRQYSIPLNPVSSLVVNVQWAIGKKNYWIDYNEDENHEINVLINIDHPFLCLIQKMKNLKSFRKICFSFCCGRTASKINFR